MNEKWELENLKKSRIFQPGFDSPVLRGTGVGETLITTFKPT